MPPTHRLEFEFSHSPRCLVPNTRADIEIRITHSGVCHSDVHTLKGEWGALKGCTVAGHEILGHVTAKGAAVVRFNVGDRVGVGPQAFSCGACKSCEAGVTTYCQKGFIGTYNGSLPNGHKSIGGYAHYNRTNQRHVFAIPDSLDGATAAPLLCAGVTVFTPLKHAGTKPGDKVAIVGCGGLGHIAVKIAKAMGAEVQCSGHRISCCLYLCVSRFPSGGSLLPLPSHPVACVFPVSVDLSRALSSQVTVISTSASKEAEARAMGASHFVLSTTPDFLTTYQRSFDTVMNTTSAVMDYEKWFKLARPYGNYVILGAAPTEITLMPISFIMSGVKIWGSLIGSPVDFAEMFALCAAHNIGCTTETFALADVNTVRACGARFVWPFGFACLSVPFSVMFVDTRISLNSLIETGARSLREESDPLPRRAHHPRVSRSARKGIGLAPRMHKHCADPNNFKMAESESEYFEIKYIEVDR